MKRKIGLVLLLLVVMLSGCEPSPGDKSYPWEIQQSPITGRYYEINHLDFGAGMSEVTQAEYEEYMRIYSKE